MVLAARIFIVLSLALAGLHVHADTLSLSCNPRLETRHGTLIVDDPDALVLLQDQQVIAAAMKLKGAERKEMLKQYFTQRPVTGTQIGATFLNYAVAIYMAWQIKAGMSADPDSVMRAAIELPPTLLASDFVSGLLHQFLDKFASESNPIWGNAARAFRIHHEYPSNLNDLSYIDNIAPFGRLMVPFYLLGAAVAPHVSPDVAFSMLTGLILFSNGSEIHRQAHLPKANLLFRALQKIKTVLNHHDHMEHHHDDHNHDFGIINGWSNGKPTNMLMKWIDHAYYKATRRMPRNWIQHPETIPDYVIDDLADDLEAIPQSLFVSALQPGNGDERVDELLRLWMEAHPANVDTSGGDNAPNP